MSSLRPGDGQIALPGTGSAQSTPDTSQSERIQSHTASSYSFRSAALTIGAGKNVRHAVSLAHAVTMLK